MPDLLKSSTGSILPISDEARAARDRLLRKIAEDTDLPSLGSSVVRVVQLASSDDDSVQELAHFVLSDVSLAQKVLRLSNTVVYRTASGGPVTTISRAIFLLGFDTIKTSALAILLVESIKGKHAQIVRTELGFALSASVIARELARRSHFKDAEEAAVAALFKNIGRVLVAAHDPQLYSQIADLSDANTHSQAQASMQVLGCTFDMLAESVLQEWHMPESIVAALGGLPQGVLKAARHRQEWLQHVAAFSAATAALIPTMTQPGTDPASRALLARFGTALNLDSTRLAELLATVVRESRALTENVELMFPPADLNEENKEPKEATIDVEVDQQSTANLPLELLLVTGQVEGDADACYPSGKPMRARDLLMAGVQDVTEMMASGQCKVNDLILLALETLYRGMGFRFVTVCLRDAKSNLYRARIALGVDSTRLQRQFEFAAGGKRDLFNLALENNADLMIADASSANIIDLVPAWHRALMPETRSFVILPLVVNGVAFGFFYADRHCVAPEGVAADETAMIKTLKGQVLAALNAR